MAPYGFLNEPEDERDPITGQPVGIPAMPQPGRELLQQGGGGPGVTVQVGAPRPETVTRDEHVGPRKTTEHSEPNPKELDAQDRLDASRASAVAATRQKLDADTQLLDAQAEAAEERRKAQVLREAQQKQLERDHAQRLAAAVAEEKAARARLEAADENTKRGYWQDHGGALGKVINAFVVGISTLAHARGGGSGYGPAWDAYQAEQARDRAGKAQQLDQAEKALLRAGKRVEDVAAWKRQKMEEYDYAQGARDKTAEATLGVITKRIGTDQARAEFEKFRAGMAEKNAQDERDMWAKHDTRIREEDAHDTHTRTVNKGGPGEAAAAGKPPTEGEAKFGMYGAQMGDALSVIKGARPLTPDELEQIQNQGEMFSAAEKSAQEGFLGAAKARAARGLKLAPKNPYEGLAPEAQQVAVAGDKIANAMLRTESGAALGELEIKRKVRNALPVAGEDPAVSAQKMQQLEREMQDYMSLGGKATTKIQEGRGGGAPAGDQGVRKTAIIDGKRVSGTVRGGKFYPDGR